MWDKIIHNLALHIIFYCRTLSSKKKFFFGILSEKHDSLMSFFPWVWVLSLYKKNVSIKNIKYHLCPFLYESVKIIIWNIWSKPTQSDLSNYNLKKSQFLKKIYWHSHFCYYKCLKLRVLHFENFSRIFKKIFSIIFIFFWKNGYWSRYPGRFKLPSILIFAKWNGPRLPRQGLHIWKSTLKNAHSKLLTVSRRRHRRR
jgi:hypothetical protein